MTTWQVKARMLYAEALIRHLTQTFDKTGEIDYGICDKIESLLWPGAPRRDITHAYELEMECP